MNQATLESLETFFTEFTRRHFGAEAFVNIHLQVKVDHSRLVAKEMRHLAQRLGLPPDQARTAEALGLLHDAGRFPQFVRYRTYADARSVDHGQLGVRTLQQEGIWARLETADRTLLAAAIRWHSARDIPANVTGERLLMTRLIRDADKLDIFRVVLAGYEWLRRDPENYPFEHECPELPGYSPEILRCVVNGERILYHMMTCMNDSRLLKVGWVFDINFKPTFERLLECRYLEQMFAYLPQDEAILAAREQIMNYIQRRLQGVC